MAAVPRGHLIRTIRCGLALLGLIAAAGCSHLGPHAPASPPETALPAAPAPTLFGWTHERGSPDRMSDEARSLAASRLLADHAPVQNLQIHGWGLPNPSPAPGRDDFAALDRRVAMMIATARQPVITLCCAPEWMKDAPSGASPQTRFEQAPARQHHADFAALAARIAARYPQVRHFLVWNEMKGYWDERQHRWDVERYTELYNQVWHAIKAVRPDAQIGGPYVVMDSHRLGTPLARSQGSAVSGAWGTLDRRSLAVVEHWLVHMAGADFVAVDGMVVAKDGRLDVDPVAAQDKFLAVQRWLRSRTTLPIWWAEWYPVPPWLDEEDGLRVAAAALQVLRRDPPAVVLFWDPRCQQAPVYGRSLCLWHERGGALVPAALVGDPTWRTQLAPVAPR